MVGSMPGARYVNGEQALPQMTVIEPWPTVSADVVPEHWVDLDLINGTNGMSDSIINILLFGGGG